MVKFFVCYLMISIRRIQVEEGLHVSLTKATSISDSVMSRYLDFFDVRIRKSPKRVVGIRLP